MAQEDYVIADQTGVSFLSDLNDTLAAIVSNNSGATEPATMYAYMFWADTTAGILKHRNAANNAWINVFTLVGIKASDIRNTAAGTIAATTVQAALNELDTEKAALAGATFTGNGGISRLGASDEPTFLIAAESTSLFLRVAGSSGSFPAGGGGNSAELINSAGDLYVGANGAGKKVVFLNGAGYTERMRIDDSGNLGINTQSPSEKLDVNGNIKAVDYLHRATATGSTVFTQSTNNIGLTGVGSIGLAIGDVITVTGTSSNNKDFTVEVITNADNIIVNQAHAGGTTGKSLVNETVSATITLIARAKDAPIDLGRDWCSPSRAAITTYTNSTGRGFEVVCDVVATTTRRFQIDGVDRVNISSAATNPTISIIIPASSTYRINGSLSSIVFWSELR